jgi:hypothetical protein
MLRGKEGKGERGGEKRKGRPGNFFSHAFFFLSAAGLEFIYSTLVVHIVVPIVPHGHGGVTSAPKRQWLERVLLRERLMYIFWTGVIDAL